MNRISWAQVGAFVAIVLVIFVVGIMLLPLLLGGYAGWGRMGPGMMGSWTEGGWCPFCGGTGRYAGGLYGGIFGWLVMLMAMLFPLGFLVLIVLGAVWLARAVSRPAAGSPVSPQVCPDCGKAVASDWRLCPYCEKQLPRSE